MCKQRTDNEDTAAQNDSTQLPSALWEALCVGLVVLTLWLSIGAAAAPRGPVFALECVFVAGVLGGRLVSLIAKKTEVPLPPLVGMLGAGIVLRNVPYLRIYIGEAVDAGSSAALSSTLTFFAEPEGSVMLSVLASARCWPKVGRGANGGRPYSPPAETARLSIDTSDKSSFS